MNYIKSCGFISYKEIDNTNYYLIIKSTNGDFGFPKGHMEKDETETQTAFRELKEETNIEVLLIEGFRYQIEYPLPKKKDTIKQSIYFLGKCINDDIICQEKEVSKAMFLTLEEALEVLTFDETKKMLQLANEYLNSIE